MARFARSYCSGSRLATYFSLWRCSQKKIAFACWEGNLTEDLSFSEAWGVSPVELSRRRQPAGRRRGTAAR
jgi:hypothetical protein